MTLEVLVSTMFDDIKLYDEMNIKGSAVIINQTDYEEKKVFDLDNKESVKFISTTERGLSRSRNMAISNSNANICLLADKEVVYEHDYISTVLKAYEDNPDADIIAFTVESTNPNRKINKLKTGRINRLTSMKVSSVQITFKRAIIDKHDLYLNEEFGTGASEFNSGEENIFLYTAIKKGLKVYYYDEKISEVSLETSTWYGKNPEKDILTKGAMFYSMSSILYPFYNLQFVIRKYNEYKRSLSFIDMLKIIFEGSRKIKNKR